MKRREKEPKPKRVGTCAECNRALYETDAIVTYGHKSTPTKYHDSCLSHQRAAIRQWNEDVRKEGAKR